MSDPAEITIPDREMTFEEFLAWAEQVPKEAGRFELWDGRVIAKKGPAGSMNAERSQHWVMKAALFVALREAVKQAAIEAHVVPEGATVRFPALGRGAEPDALVYLGPAVARDALIVPAPVIVCEVLSPTTAKHDMSAKLEAYFTLPSVQHYIIADPDKPLLIVHSRQESSLLTTRLVSDPAVRLRLDPPGLDLDLSEVLAGH
jgi:Uma2 family endonuclease